MDGGTNGGTHNRRKETPGRRFSDLGAAGWEVSVARLEERLVSAVEKQTEFSAIVARGLEGNGAAHDKIMARMETSENKFFEHKVGERWFRWATFAVISLIAGEKVGPHLLTLLKGLLLP